MAINKQDNWSCNNKFDVIFGERELDENAMVLRYYNAGALRIYSLSGSSLFSCSPLVGNSLNGNTIIRGNCII